MPQAIKIPRTEGAARSDVTVAPDAMFGCDVPGTRAYRARHISMLWTAQLWHEAIMVAAAAVSVGFMLYALRPVLS